MVYFDFDGTLKVWDTTKSLEEVGEKDYPRVQAWNESVRYAAKKLISDLYPVTVFTAVLNADVKETKKAVITNEFGTDVAEKMITVMFGDDKSSAAPKNGKRVGIKVYTPVNGHNGTWDGFSVRSTAKPETVYEQLKAIIDLILSKDPDTDILIDDFTFNLFDWEERS